MRPDGGEGVIGRAVRSGRGDRAGRAAHLVTYLEDLCVAAADTRLKVEQRLIACVLACPRIGVLRCRERGVCAELFEHDDFALMYAAAEVRHADGADDDATQLAVLSMARFALKEHGFWDDAAIAAERGMAWSERNLVSLACRDGRAADVCFWADELVRVARNHGRARRFWRAMVGLLKDCCATREGGGVGINDE